MPKTSLLDLIFPSKCAVCEAGGPNLCEGCKFVLEPRPHDFQRGVVTGLAASNYSPEVSKLIVAFKDRGQFALVNDLGRLMEPLVRRIEQVPGSFYLVPAPSRIQNFTKRGFQPSLLLARQLGIRVPNARILNCLRLGKEVLDQVGLSSADRITNLSGSMKLNQSVSGKNVFIVDDVVTTGATITEAWKVVSLGGGTVLSALVVSEARR